MRGRAGRERSLAGQGQAAAGSRPCLQQPRRHSASREQSSVREEWLEISTNHTLVPRCAGAVSLVMTRRQLVRPSRAVNAPPRGTGSRARKPRSRMHEERDRALGNNARARQ